MPHLHDAVMTLCVCVGKMMKERSSLFSFFMTKAHSTLMMVKGGFGLKLENNPFGQRGKGEE